MRPELKTAVEACVIAARAVAQCLRHQNDESDEWAGIDATEDELITAKKLFADLSGGFGEARASMLAAMCRAMWPNS